MVSQLVHMGPCVSCPGQPTTPTDTTGQRCCQVSASLAITPTVIPTMGNTRQPPSLPTWLSIHTLGLLLTWLTCPSSSGWGSHPSPSTEGKCLPTLSTQQACQPRLTKHLRHPRRQTLKESQHKSLLSLVF